MKRVATGIALFAIASIACAEAMWIDSAESSAHKYSIKGGSFNVTKDKSGAAVAVVTGRSEAKLTNTIKVEKWYVRIADCKKEEGKLITTDLSGKFVSENDFVFGAGSVASAHAETICAGYEILKTQTAGKGL